MTDLLQLPFSRVLIANRGEIAVRIARTCHELGLTVIAIYSDADRNALHVQAADEAYCVGPAPAPESYLNVDAVMAAVAASRAEAVHPGYGFLAENPQFATAVQNAGVAWVGPPPEVIALLGDKVAAKELAHRADVPCVPGYDGEVQEVDRMRAEAERIGFPVMLKAAAGGGGKGMRAVASAADLPAALAAATREAVAAFGDGRVFIEKLIEQPRHVEVQVIADTFGHAAYLGERDCSVQRRHQKVVEEAPSPAGTSTLRAAMGEAALRLVLAGGYRNVGTVEFLCTADQYYFLEVNTRIQVEHAVTEMVTGLDLVRLQLEVAAGLPLPLTQRDVTLVGHAIEARVYAEDPAHEFLPSTGTITSLGLPCGPGIRNDVGVEVGSSVTPYYDPMLAKLIVQGTNRADAVARLQAALAIYTVEGPRTNLDFLRWLVTQPQFIAGEMTIDFVDTRWEPALAAPLPYDVATLAAIAAAARPVSVSSASPWNTGNGWRLAGFRRIFRFLSAGTETAVELLFPDTGLVDVAIDGIAATFAVLSASHSEVILRQEHRILRAEVKYTSQGMDLTTGDGVFRLTSATVQAGGDAGKVPAAGTLTAPMPGTVLNVMVVAGQRVKAHEPLAILEAMKMEHVVEAPRDGVVRAVLVEPGTLVAAGSVLAELESE